jgi:peptide/nickel transport system ATP-binding protein
VQRQIFELLDDLRQNNDLSMMFISHDLAVVRKICARIGVMRLGSIVEIGDVDEVFDQPSHDYTRELIKAMPSTRGLGEAIAGDRLAMAT